MLWILLGLLIAIELKTILIAIDTISIISRIRLLKIKIDMMGFQVAKSMDENCTLQSEYNLHLKKHHYY